MEQTTKKINLTIANMEKICYQTAKKLFNEGKQIIICPCRYNIYSEWRVEAKIKKDILYSFGKKSFDEMCEFYKHYNCNSELGKNLAYYIEESVS